MLGACVAGSLLAAHPPVGFPAARDLVIRALGDGLYVGEHFDGEQRLDALGYNAMWPGLVGKGSPGAEPCIDLDTMLDLTAKAEVNGVRFDGVALSPASSCVRCSAAPAAPCPGARAAPPSPGLPPPRRWLRCRGGFGGCGVSGLRPGR